MPKPSQTFDFDALGTKWTIQLLGQSTGGIERSVLDRVRQFEVKYSRFDPHSMIGVLNRDKVLANPPQELQDMLVFARDMYHATHGVFNLSVVARLTRLGYGKGDQSAHINTDDSMGIDIEATAIRLAVDTEIDLGGFGKGWLIDELARLLRHHDIDQFVINGGGDIYVSSNTPIELALEHPLDTTQMIGTTRITRGALAVSSPYKRSWKVGGDTKHHIIDPRTGEPVANDVACVYVRADSTRVADVMATVIMIDPSQLDRLKEDFGLDVIIVRESQLD